MHCCSQGGGQGWWAWGCMRGLWQQLAPDRPSLPAAAPADAPRTRLRRRWGSWCWRWRAAAAAWRAPR
jgi:hypothetical protein